MKERKILFIYRTPESEELRISELSPTLLAVFGCGEHETSILQVQQVRSPSFSGFQDFSGIVFRAAEALLKFSF